MVAQAKIDAVKEYLQGEFPGFCVDDDVDFDRASRKFSAAKGATIHIVKLERPFRSSRTLPT